MRWETLVACIVATASVVSAGRSLAHAGQRTWQRAFAKKRAHKKAHYQSWHQAPRRASEPKFRNEETMPFAVNGTSIPEVDFDVGESYAGSLPIGSDGDPNLFFWFFPSTNEMADKEITIWLNGGPGCSSLEGLLQENGPFLWQYGTFKPYPNRWSWHNLTNVVWVEQPVGTGFATGQATATCEEDVAKQFMGFWKNFVDTFGMQGYKVYITGESYAGMYCPHIAKAFLEAKNTTYYDVRGMMIYDPAVNADPVLKSIPTVQFTDYWGGLFPFNETFRKDIHDRDRTCGYSAWMDKYLVYPPAGQIPSLPGVDINGVALDQCTGIYDDVWDAISEINPCFDIYQVATTCPLLWDVLGFPGSFNYLPEGAELYFNRTDVKEAIHAPKSVNWMSCATENVFVNQTDHSVPLDPQVLTKVIEGTDNVIISHGALDMIYIANGTLVTIQNLTWNGKIGFQNKPVEPFFVPYHDEDPSGATLAGSGVLGTTHTERGLTYVGINLAGHMIPQYAPTAAYRQLEFLLGRVDCMNCTEPFTTQDTVKQPVDSLGAGRRGRG